MITFDAESRCFHLANDRISYIIRLGAGKYPLHLYWGPRVRRVSEDLLSALSAYTDETFSLHGLPLDRLPQECPTYGCADLREGMLQVRHADGTHALDLQYESHAILSGKPPLAGLPSARGETAQTLVLTLTDGCSGLSVRLLYTLWEDVDIIARSVEIVNRGSAPVVLDRVLSACVDFEQADFSLLTLSGAWARERQPFLRPLVPGDQGVSTARGASSAQTSPFLALLSPGATEEQGLVYAFALCYSGSFTASVHVDQDFTARAMLGIQPFGFSWTLASGERFQAPEAYLCCSAQGLGGMSRQFHRLVHRHITTGPYAQTARPILINNWEATYFDFNEEKLLALARQARAVGIDLFVLDDGWFGHRDRDDSSLGDWWEDLRKLPQGLGGLSSQIHAMGMKFGLWVEPEMVSPDSRLYRAHPDWCIHVPGRLRTEARHQLVLDLSRPEVRDYIVEAISEALTRGQVDYVKWDMNRNITMWGSQGLPAGRQQELPHRYILGLYEVMGRVIRRFPQVLFESCAGGGGRFDLGLMCLMPQAWCSDDTDAWMRCRIQYGTSLLFPPSVMGAHVSAVPNHQTGRSSPLFTRAAVAMGGSYGYELDLGKLPEAELAQIRELNTRVHSMQQLLLYGDFYRLRSPFSGNDCAWMSVSPDRREAVVTHVFALAQPNTKPRLLRLRGLDPALDYRDADTGRVWGGDELLSRGLRLETPWNDYQAQQFHLVALPHGESRV
ncbi:MAG: alpha-galactosidase [Clostridiales bacterium]|nr:alpha-galactosidase [Clostridiales bacterium]